VYVSDAPGHHNPELLGRLALRRSGRTLQPAMPGRPTRDCLFTDACKDGVTALKACGTPVSNAMPACLY
jgi:hypothetical protein